MFELIEVQSKVREAASKQIAKHVESRMEAEKLANQYNIDLSMQEIIGETICGSESFSTRKTTGKVPKRGAGGSEQK